MFRFFTALAAAALLLSPLATEARGHRGGHHGGGGRVHYGGSHHSGSHGGHYAGGHGSSHRSGHYRNLRTGNRYGCHSGC